MGDFERSGYLNQEGEQDAEQGFALLAMVVAIFLVLLVLGVAAPKVAQDLRRDREVEAMHRGNQYVRAVQLYYRKFGHYPGSIEQLDKTNNIRFLRQKYVDPMTGKSDWRLIHVGEAKTTVKGFFGEPLAGIATQGLGAMANSQSSGMGGTNAGGAAGSTSAFGGSSGSGFGSSSGSAFGGGAGRGGTGLGGGSGTGFGSGSGTAGAGAAGTGAAGTGSGTGSSNGLSSQSGSSFTGTGGLIVGIGSAASGNSIVDLNAQTSYDTWEFIYDPRIELLKAKASLLGGPATANAGSLGANQGSQSSGFGGSGTPPTAAPGGAGGANGSGTTLGAPVRP